MENLCGILYEAFRPRIIHMTHMETLSEICNILKVNIHRLIVFIVIFVWFILSTRKVHNVYVDEFVA